MSLAPLCDKNLPWQHDWAVTGNLSLRWLANILKYWSMQCLQLDFSQGSRMQDKTISRNTNTIKSPDLPCYKKSPTDLKLKNSSRIRTEFTMSSQHSSALKRGLSGVIHKYSIYSKADGIPYSIIPCFPYNLSGIVLEKGRSKKVAPIVKRVLCSQLPVNLTRLQ